MTGFNRLRIGENGAVLNTVMNFRISYMVTNLLTEKPSASQQDYGAWS